MQVQTLSQKHYHLQFVPPEWIGTRYQTWLWRMSIWSMMTPSHHIVPGSYRRHWFQAVQQFVPPKGIGGTKPACENVHMINDDAQSITLFHIVTRPYTQGSSFKTLIPSSTKVLHSTEIDQRQNCAYMINDNVKGINHTVPGSSIL